MSIRKPFSMLGMALILGLGLASCGGSANEEFFSFQTFSLSTMAEGADNDSIKDQMVDFDGRWEVSVSGIMPVKIGDHQLTNLCDTLARLTCVNFSSQQAVIQLPAELKALATNAKDTVAPGSKLMKRTTLDMLSPLTAVFRVYTYAYPEGAAHGVYSNRYVNYDVVGGQVITLDMLFNPGYQRELQPEIVSRLKSAHGDLLVEDDEVEVSPVFRITEDGVDFIYGIYSVAPYSDGEPIVSFTPYELDGLLSAQGKTLLGLTAADS